jgi:hypothetical protein
MIIARQVTGIAAESKKFFYVFCQKRFSARALCRQIAEKFHLSYPYL